ncbi:hypothetical protein SacRon12I_07455 [Sulfolobus acidocaldarius Ron12/I]|uniref:Uncharacterized protein n=1 Tax=Sulfolobus acidocaldarius Ron12/I TaxID=1028567 RepID=M1IZ34_9CREN|nr:hypothetical protein SacRon12I_07455 [Sulfolobus acidocaldarius Ron12/I]
MTEEEFRNTTKTAATMNERGNRINKTFLLT